MLIVKMNRNLMIIRNRLPLALQQAREIIGAPMRVAMTMVRRGSTTVTNNVWSILDTG
jgi:hypothetical protein